MVGMVPTRMSTRRPAVVDLDMPVLRHEPLGDVHVRHDLDAGNQRRMKLLGGRRFLLQQPVHPVAQLQRFLKRQQMNIARPLAQRRGNDQVDQVDDRRLVGHHLDVVQILALRPPRCSGCRFSIICSTVTW